MPHPEPAIDFTQIEFPSDRLTVKELRKAIPHSFDLPAREGYSPTEKKGFFKRESLENYLGGILNTERELAALAFDAALGRKEPEYDEGRLGPRQEAAEALLADYPKVGLTIHGEHHGQQIIRDIASQAEAQAQRYLGPTPTR